jgi:hypothetical protein
MSARHDNRIQHFIVIITTWPSRSVTDLVRIQLPEIAAHPRDKVYENRTRTNYYNLCVLFASAEQRFRGIDITLLSSVFETSTS